MGKTLRLPRRSDRTPINAAFITPFPLAGVKTTFSCTSDKIFVRTTTRSPSLTRIPAPTVIFDPPPHPNHQQTKKKKGENLKKKKPDAKIAQIIQEIELNVEQGAPRRMLVTDEPNQPGWDASFILGNIRTLYVYSAAKQLPNKHIKINAITSIKKGMIS